MIKMSYQRFLQNIQTIVIMTRMDIHKRYLNTFLGAIWNLILPIATISIIFVVFSYAFKSPEMGNIPFVYWLVPGMMAWFYLSDSVVAGCNSILEYPHLVTKIRFPVVILPIVKSLSSIPVHIILMALFLAVLVVNGMKISLLWLELIYFLFSGFILCLGISYVTSACTVFIRDITGFVSVIVQILFWATPILWNPDQIKGTMGAFLIYSPFNYIISGYRDCLYGSGYFWEKPIELLIFWIMAVSILSIGLIIFHRTRPHFADVI